MNNTGILKKAIDELSKESPKLEYVRGILETLYDLSESVQPVNKYAVPGGTTPMFSGDKGFTANSATVSESETDEAAILDAKARAAIGAVQALAEQSKTE